MLAVISTELRSNLALYGAYLLTLAQLTWLRTSPGNSYGLIHLHEHSYGS